MNLSATGGLSGLLHGAPALRQSDSPASTDRAGAVAGAGAAAGTRATGQGGLSHLLSQLTSAASSASEVAGPARSMADLLRLAPQRVSAVDAGGYDRIRDPSCGPFCDRQVSASAYSELNETELAMELQTRDGDVVRIRFRQTDYAATTQLASGSVSEHGLERVFDLSVEGNLSDAERGAIDRMLEQVAEQATSLFTGDLGQTAARLAALDFDSEQLATFALDFTRTTQQSLTQVYGGGMPGLAGLARHDDAVSSLLELLADTQRQLIAEARTLFDDASAAGFARGVVPQLFALHGPQDADAPKNADRPQASHGPA